ncbi:D-alanyl-D-alanine-carboxypeptidase/endopeptidase AmpH precursor [Stieleria maiorica]|uniref:D-alanyl-D-alanine-carboxypeptidase/endopeptidase AmpH n=1 Tax=Stieleria maiorica TaxID=2795974 RepID=A0A5B9MBA4_9BACT|nr:serine hydrolase [Stieleria maiorica]QEF98571.1 D-alanyl-D-alanine-carboxypeptidase/endopeptidase AmpH precursor [Stieleria maiorica]
MTHRLRAAVVPAFFCILLLIIPTALSAAPPDLNDPATRQRVRSLVQPYLDNELVVGLSLGLIAGDRAATFHFGKTSQDGPAPDDQTVYEIGSVTKVFTGILLADAVVQNKVKLDQDAAELMPDGARMPESGGKSITLLDLSIHRSGLPRLPSNMTNVGGENPYADYTSDLALEFLNEYSLTRDPGDAMEYSNLAVSFLGYLLCRQAGKSYDELFSQRVTGPLGMSDTTVTGNDDVLQRLATGHDALAKPRSTWEFADMPGAGGIRSTVTDMLRFAKANLDPPDNDLGKAIQLAWKQHRAGDAKDFAMGLGWHLARDGSTRWHNGQTGGFHAMLFVNRQIPAAVVLLTNTATMEVDRLAEDLIRMLAGAPVEPRTFESAVKVPVVKMKRCEGRYQLAPGAVFDINVVNDRLMVQLTGQPALQVFPKSETEWFYKVVQATLTFKDANDGRFDSVELFQNGVRLVAKRIEPSDGD